MISVSTRRWSSRRTTWAPRSITAEVADVDADFSGTIYDYSLPGPAQSSLRVAVRLPPLPQRDSDVGQRGAAARPRVRVRRFDAALYREWLENACRYTDAWLGPEKPFVFINAWNEWAEGAHLEPDRAHGYAYLQATADALRQFPVNRPSIVVVSHDAYFHGAQRLALALTTTLAQSLGYEVEVLLCGDGPLTSEFAKVGRVHEFSAAAATLEARQRIASDLFNRGARLALCNTSVVGDTVELLKRAGFKVVSMIHELPGLISQYGLEASIASIARHADRVVFPARIVRDPFIDLTGMPLRRRSSDHRVCWLRTASPTNAKRRGTRSGRCSDCLRMPRSSSLSALLTGARGSISSSRSASISSSGGPTSSFVWVGHHDADAFSRRAGTCRRVGPPGAVLLPGPGRESRRVFCRRGHLPDDVAGGSVPVGGARRARRTSPRRRVRRRRRLRRAPGAGLRRAGPLSRHQGDGRRSLPPPRESLRGESSERGGQGNHLPGVLIHRLRARPRASCARPASVGDRAELQLRALPEESPAFDRDPDVPAARDHLSRRLFV